MLLKSEVRYEDGKTRTGMAVKWTRETFMSPVVVPKTKCLRCVFSYRTSNCWSNIVGLGLQDECWVSFPWACNLHLR